MSVGVPVKVLHEAEGLIVTAELRTGEMYRGKLVDSEDNMNCHMQDVTYTARDGRVSHLDAIFIRGSKLRFLLLPDMLKNAPMFKRADPKTSSARGKGLGLGRARGGIRGRGRGRRGSTTPGNAPPHSS
ncbi:small nuclear ribonucleoprotein Sm D3 [Pelomyxa schiedti]|nr:small nuclear ribonucleoprotein Sm D3 [Pelomyxa schiedti]